MKRVGCGIAAISIALFTAIPASAATSETSPWIWNTTPGPTTTGPISLSVKETSFDSSVLSVALRYKCVGTTTFTGPSPSSAGGSGSTYPFQINFAAVSCANGFDTVEVQRASGSGTANGVLTHWDNTTSGTTTVNTSCGTTATPCHIIVDAKIPGSSNVTVDNFPNSCGLTTATACKVEGSTSTGSTTVEFDKDPNILTTQKSVDRISQLLVAGISVGGFTIAGIFGMMLRRR